MDNILLGFGTVLLSFGLYIKYEKSLKNSHKITPIEAKNFKWC
jgi:hypothetical protein